MTDFPFTGTYATYTVPAGVTELIVDIFGAAGGDQGAAPIQPFRALGGYGAYMQVRLTVTPGQVLRVYPGGRGDSGVTISGVGSAGHGGYNGGGNGGYVNVPGAGAQQIPAGGGGGRSEIRASPYGTGDALVVAGGGGGAGSNGTGAASSSPSSGGSGGYSNGVDGVDGVLNSGSRGRGGTTSAGGAGGTHAGTGSNGSAGAANVGGAGAVLTRGGGGGGAGVYGGGGGGGSNTSGTSGGGGGGGASDTGGTVITSGVAPTRDHGFVRIRPVRRLSHMRQGLGFGPRYR